MFNNRADVISTPRNVYLNWFWEDIPPLLRPCRPFSIHVRHILPTSKFQHSYYCIWLIFYISEQHVWELWVWLQFIGLTFPLWVTPMNRSNPITLISPVQSLGYIFCCRWQYMRSSAIFRTVFSESQNANPLDAELQPDFNAKWPFDVIQGHPFRCQWRACKGLQTLHRKI